VIFNLKKASGINDVEEQKKYERLGFRYIKGDMVTYTDRHHIPQIEINTLEELINFVKEYGPVVVSENEITIYDDYLE